MSTEELAVLKSMIHSLHEDVREQKAEIGCVRASQTKLELQVTNRLTALETQSRADYRKAMFGAIASAVAALGALAGIGR